MKDEHCFIHRIYLIKQDEHCFISADRIVTKYRNDPWKMKIISRHFYLEKVYDDSTSDQPKLRQRYRNSFSDIISYSQRVQDSNADNDSDAKSHSDAPHSNHHDDFEDKLNGDSYDGSRNELSGRKSNKEFKKSPVSVLRHHYFQIQRNRLSFCIQLDGSNILYYCLLASYCIQRASGDRGLV